MGRTYSIEGLLIYATGKPHPLWHGFGKGMGSHPGEVWVIDQEFLACFLITLEVGTCCCIHPFPLDPSLSQRVCTEMLAVIFFWRLWAVQVLALYFLWTIYFCIFFQLQPIVVRGVCEEGFFNCGLCGHNTDISSTVCSHWYIHPPRCNGWF